jgi:hypothetical protein
MRSCILLLRPDSCENGFHLWRVAWCWVYVCIVARADSVCVFYIFYGGLMVPSHCRKCAYGHHVPSRGVGKPIGPCIHNVLSLGGFSPNLLGTYYDSPRVAWVMYCSCSLTACARANRIHVYVCLSLDGFSQICKDHPK